MKDTLTICAVFRDEAEYLDEWLTFHSHVGVDRFYLYDDGSTDRYREVLDPWIRSNRVVLRSAEGRRQNSIYNDCLKNHRFNTKWIAFIDIDEFLWSPSDVSTIEVLGDFVGAAAVLVRWVLFGSSGHTSRPKLPVLEAYTKCRPAGAELDAQSTSEPRPKSAKPRRVTGNALQGKSIVNPRRVFRMGIHTPEIYFGSLVSEAGSTLSRLAVKNHKARQAFWRTTPVDRLRINHYWSRSIEELSDKVRRRVGGSIFKGEGLDYDETLQGCLEREKSLNQETDLSIQAAWAEALENRPKFTT